MERLTKGDGNCAWAYKDGLPLEPNELSYADNRTHIIGDLMRKLAAYEDAEEQGLLVRLPCKIGTVCYRMEYDAIYPTVFNYGDIPYWGRTIFPTIEEAKAARAKEG